MKNEKPEQGESVEDTQAVSPSLYSDEQSGADERGRADGKTSDSFLGTLWNKWSTIRDRPSQTERLVAGTLCILLVLLIWHILTMGEPEKRFISAYTLPSLGEMFGSIKSLWFDRALMRSTMWSLGRVLGGFMLAAAFAVPLGVMAACFPRINAFFRPLSVFGRNIPIAALIPLTLIWFGLGESQKVMFIFLSSVAFIFFDTTHAVDGVSSRFLDTAYTLGARPVPKQGLIRSLILGGIYGVLMILALIAFQKIEVPSMAWLDVLKKPGIWIGGAVGLVGGFLVWWPIQSHQAIRKVLLPLALPQIVNSLRLLYGLAFGYIMLAEVINAKLGLGNIIIMSQRRGPREHIYLILIIIALLAFAIDRLVLWQQKRWFPYREEGDA